MSIKFNNVTLESVAPVKIDDIRVSPIQLNPVARERAIQYGSDFVRMRGGNRTVTITFALLEDNRTDREAHLAAITNWAKQDAEYKLVLPHYSDRYLEAVCTGLPEPSYRMWWESKLRLVFTCFSNPYWTSSTEKTASCGSTAFTAGGNAPPLMWITNTFASAATNAAWSDGTNTLTFSSIAAGDVTIDLNRQVAKKGSSSIMSALTYTSKFIVPKTGSMTITGSGTVHYRERWL